MVTKSTRNQQSYTQGILSAAGHDPDDYLQYIRVWWWNHTDSSSLRLSKSGLDFIKKSTQIPVYECVLAEPLRNRTLIQLSRFFTCPYYLMGKDKIVLLGKDETVLLKLHADNLQQYLDNLELSQS